MDSPATQYLAVTWPKWRTLLECPPLACTVICDDCVHPKKNHTPAGCVFIEFNVVCVCCEFLDVGEVDENRGDE